MTRYDPYYDDYSHPVRHERWCKCTGCVQMWGEARQRGLPKRKSRVSTARESWQRVVGFHDWVELFNTVQHHQLQVRVWMDHYRSTYDAPHTTQERLDSLE
jgi:hypothetical protein